MTKTDRYEIIGAQSAFWFIDWSSWFLNIFLSNLSGPIYCCLSKKVKPLLLSLQRHQQSPCFKSLWGPGLHRRSCAKSFLAVTTPFARMALSRRLLSEPYLDAALHDVLLHLPSQISDHMPCTDSFLVLLLPPLPTYTVEYIIYTLNNNFLGHWISSEL